MKEGGTAIVEVHSIRLIAVSCYQVESGVPIDVTEGNTFGPMII